MKRLLVILSLVFGASAASADIIVATQIIRANSIITSDVIGVKRGTAQGVYDDPAEVLGQEARKSLYPGRPIKAGDVGPPALVDRNQIVTLIFDGSGIQIATEGRALDRGGVGEQLRVMNMGSRSTVTGTVMSDGTVRVSK
ncbi:MAG: flagellar basal body P-ring formation chaperone FlgA [Shimia sp.]|jgi:flagella basal body P-ring formation protein FlgA|uniref:flagellar basal body P-ring formation chaperone FlgA n=1 Tax=unclassified Shimia TaxID=2630038 RepID=UPI0006B611FB|nr:flagellar basal body P-ring formation chaperone FlgA [Shimia sp. SK013]KPA20333.1 flagellar basal body P-ring biosynthesis protein FlgA [Shimia sp. SK013]